MLARYLRPTGVMQRGWLALTATDAQRRYSIGSDGDLRFDELSDDSDAE